MAFNVNKFAKEFKNTIEWMLKNTYAQKLNEDLRFFKNNKKELQRNPDSLDALRMIIELIKTNSWRLKKPKDFDEKMDSFIGRYGANFRTKRAKEELIKLVGNRRKKNIQQLLRYSTIKQFTESLYSLATQGKTVVLGEKGREGITIFEIMDIGTEYQSIDTR